MENNQSSGAFSRVFGGMIALGIAGALITGAVKVSNLLDSTKCPTGSDNMGGQCVNKKCFDAEMKERTGSLTSLFPKKDIVGSKIFHGASDEINEKAAKNACLVSPLSNER